MKNHLHLMPLMDKLLLRKRFIIETLFHKLKSHIEVAAHPPPIAQQCLGSYLFLHCRLHPRATQSQDWTSGHARFTRIMDKGL